MRLHPKEPPGTATADENNDHKRFIKVLSLHYVVSLYGVCMCLCDRHSLDLITAILYSKSVVFSRNYVAHLPPGFNQDFWC